MIYISKQENRIFLLDFMRNNNLATIIAHCNKIIEFYDPNDKNGLVFEELLNKFFEEFGFNFGVDI